MAEKNAPEPTKGKSAPEKGAPQRGASTQHKSVPAQKGKNAPPAKKETNTVVKIVLIVLGAVVLLGGGYLLARYTGFGSAKLKALLAYPQDILTGWREDAPFQSYELDEYVKLGEYKGIPVTLAKEEVTDAEVNTTAQGYFSESGISLGVKQTPGKTKVEAGDTIEFDFEGSADGVSAETLEGMKATNYVLTIGSGNFIPGFEDELIGATIGKEIDVKVTFPDEYSEELAGKPAVFKCTVHKIGSEVITDSAVANLTSGQLTTVKELMDYVRTDLVNQIQQENAYAAFEAAYANAEILQIPDRERKYYEDMLSSQIAGSYSSPDDYLSQNGYSGTYEDYKLEYDEENIKRDLFAFAVAEKENLSVDGTYIADAINNVRQNNSDMASLSDEEILDQNGGRGFVIRYLVAERVRAFLYDNAVKSFE
ncbi:MAG: FKBP-type peptidyl-prolyl cis-trans isomerase [Oscillospiraceae bacterium]|nr:FKBP-type peptidyl-prolyl cis-trans isomerase [Oscillospiraceae bacterium]